MSRGFVWCDDMFFLEDLVQVVSTTVRLLVVTQMDREEFTPNVWGFFKGVGEKPPPRVGCGMPCLKKSSRP